MTPLIKILAGVVPGVALLSLSILLFWWRRRRQQPRPQQQLISSANAAGLAVPSPSQDGFQSAIDKFRNRSNKNSLHFQQLNPKQNIQQQQQQQEEVPPHFSWDAHPRLISEVVDHGWSQFVFADRSSVPRSSPLWSLCASCDSGWPQESQQISWEVQANTSEFMQTARISPLRTKKTASSSTNSSPLFPIDSSATSCTRMSLPLPGPPLIGSSFPQEAYFEISITQLQPPNQPSGPRRRLKDGDASDGDDDRLKLIDQNPSKVHSDGRIESNYSPTTTEVKPNKPLICLGLTRGGSTETRLIPGTYPGSIGFQSNGSVYLDGLHLVSESNKTEWATVDKVIGCGFSPSRKKVYFTIDSELVHVIRCNSEVYKSPLYPILASNSDVTIVVNLGQVAFKYVPANSHRTANPCFLQSSPSYSCHSVGAYEDSREFFSVGMQDAECSDYAAANGKSNSKGSTKSSKRIKYNWDEESVNLDVDKTLICLK
ncbi:uncharacterized protein M6B38_177560 [Iris pallida]|uniref:SPRY domain-containing protein n=1 Tax=Iris pallida TaxID=29817 RepID=A0AAX6EPW6_IRIPA|nr:uncharacterized protein M6B38_177560 [Iris pallida]